MKKLLLITTGGTIASAKGEEGLEPELTSSQLLDFLPPQSDISIDCIDLMKIDSSNMQPEEWQVIAREIARHVDEFDGIVLTHGTDTMAYL